jgi:flagellar assembly protein FliH
MSEPSTWDLPDVRGPVVAPRGRSPSIASLVEVEQAAWRQGFEQGRRDGLAAIEAGRNAALAAIEESAARVAQVCERLSRPLEPLDEELAAELVALALRVGAQLARRDLALDPSQVIAIIREAVGLLPIGARDIRVYVHPLDGAAIRERLAATSADRAWQLLDDPVMPRGGCRVASEYSQIDARLDSRLATIIATLLGEERSGERAGSPPAAREPSSDGESP